MGVQHEQFPHEQFPESQHIASGNGYPDEQRTRALDEIAVIAKLLRSVPAWKLTPYTETLMQAERFLASIESALAASGDLIADSEELLETDSTTSEAEQ